MEPVFMILGQSAATAACIAIDDKVPVQVIAYAKLRERLLKDGQVLEWKPGAGLTPAPKLPGIVLDDADAKREGDWIEGGVHGSQRVGTGYLHDGNDSKGRIRVTWTASVPAAGGYEVLLHFPPNANRATNVPVTLAVAGESPRTVHVNQRTKSGAVSLGKIRIAAGQSLIVTLSNESTDGFVVADGLQLLPAK
jgi:hypothetical protein